VRRPPLEATVGWGLLAVALLGPVLYPWYLAPAAAVLGTLATAQARFLSAACGAEGLLLAIPRIGRFRRVA
jgi:alpha-1,6-mannosyltransferase